MTDTTGRTADDLRDCLKSLDLQGNLLSMDADGLCVMEIDDFAPLRGQPWSAFWPEASKAVVEAAVEKARGGRVARFQADCPTAKGTLKSWDVAVSPVRDASGEIVSIQSLSQDITQREFDIRENAMVSRELTHRIKNLFATLDGIIALSARGHPGAEAYVATLRDRLGGLSRAVSFIHPMGGVDDQTTPSALSGLLEAILAPYRRGAVIDLTGSDIRIDTSALTSLALVLNELTTNAVKYGALSGAEGRLTVASSVVDDHVVIHWAEQVAGPVVEPASTGFGSILLDRTIRRQLGGAFTRRWGDRGVLVEMRLPLARLVKADALV